MASHFLPMGGRFSSTQSASFVEETMAEEATKPGPGTYEPVLDKTFDRLPNGGRFMQSNSKSQLDWAIYNAAQLPGPGEYAPKRLSSDGGIINKNKAKSALDWVIYHAEQLPGPGAYETKSMPLPEGGRFNVSQAKSQLDQTVFDAKRLPGPGEYDFPRWPSPSHGRFSSPADVRGMVDHLHKHDPEKHGPDDPGPRPTPSLDIYRDGSFRMSAQERSQATLKSLESSMQPSAKKDKLTKHTTTAEFEQQRIRKAQQAGEGTAKEAITTIFEHLAKTKSKVVDVFKKIDKDGNGELDAGEFQRAMQMLGLFIPRSQAKLVLEDFDKDGNGTIDIEEFINTMRTLARTRRAEQKAEDAIPDWIKQADKGKPPDRLDLGWRQLAPAKVPKPQPSRSEQAAAYFRANRPKSGGGTPFCSGGNGGRWRAGETSSMKGQQVDGWKAAHSGWQINTSSEFGGVGERLGSSHLGSKSFSSLGIGTKHATKRINAARKLAAHSTCGNDHAKGVAEISVFQKSPRKLASSSAMRDTYSRSLSDADLVAFRQASEARLLAARDKDLELYGTDGEKRVEGQSRARGPNLIPAPSVEDSARIMALSHDEWNAFKAPRYEAELNQLVNRSVVVPVTSDTSHRLAAGTKKMRSHRVTDKHPLLRRSSSPQRLRASNRGPNSRSTGVPFDRSTSPKAEEKARSGSALEVRFGLASGSGPFSVSALG